MHVHPWIHCRLPHHHPWPCWRVVVRDSCSCCASRHDPYPGRPFLLYLLAGDNVHKEVEYISPCDCCSNVVLLQGTPLVLLCMEPRADGELEDEELARLGEEDGSLCGDHAHVLVGLHDLLDAGEGELVVLEVIGVLDPLALVGPEHLELLVLLLEEVVVERSRVRVWRWRWWWLLLVVILH